MRTDREVAAWRKWLSVGAALAVAALGLAALVAAPKAFAHQNGGGSGGTTMGDLTASGYSCIAQDPRTGNVWCVRDAGETNYVCTPAGECYPVGPGTKPPWASVIHHGGTGIGHLPPRTTKSAR